MKSKVFISIIICFFFFQGVGISQTAKKDKKAQAAKKSAQTEFLEQMSKKPMYEQVIMLDSVFKARGVSRTAPSAGWSRAQDSYFQMLDNTSKSSLSFRKEFIEKKTINRSYDMEFTKDHKSLSIRINAQAREGKIRIIIMKPDGKNFKVLEVEDMESLGWNQTLNAYTEENKKGYIGTWQIKVEVQNAKGYYDIKLSLK